MARPLRIQYPGALYHVTCRGIERRKIYMDDKDRFKFLALLSESLENYQVLLHSFILMSNHFHLLIQTRKANCSEFMRHFNICYTGWFNWRHDRCGNLYQGRYKAYLVDIESYLLEVSRYLHLNCVRTRRVRSSEYRDRWRCAKDYKWSSLAGYVSVRQSISLVNYDLILPMVGSRRAYRDFMLDGLKHDMVDPFKKVRNGIILGDDDFAEEVKQYLKRASCREQPSYRDIITPVLEPDVVLGILEREYRISEESIRQRGANGVLRGIVAELLYKYCEITQAQIGGFLGDIDYMSVSQLRRRLKERMSEDAEISRRYTEFEASIKKLM